MVFAKTSKAASRLSEQVRLNKIKKVYLATDCEKDFEKKVLEHLKSFNVKVEVCGTRQEFAKLCNIEVLCAVIGILS